MTKNNAKRIVKEVAENGYEDTRYNADETFTALAILAAKETEDDDDDDTPEVLKEMEEAIKDGKTFAKQTQLLFQYFEDKYSGSPLYKLTNWLDDLAALAIRGNNKIEPEDD